LTVQDESPPPEKPDAEEGAEAAQVEEGSSEPAEAGSSVPEPAVPAGDSIGSDSQAESPREEPVEERPGEDAAPSEGVTPAGDEPSPEGESKPEV
jgi:hypothetical protein